MSSPPRLPPPARRLPRARLVPGLVLAGLLASGAGARGARVVDRFYEAKQRSTGTEAFARALGRLHTVELGIGELELLDRLEMEALGRGKKVIDVRLDGYLPEASRRASREDRGGGHHLVFGYVQEGREVIRVTVVLRDHRVTEIRVRGRGHAPCSPFQARR